MIINNISLEQIQLFISIFKGRNDVYARYWEKNGKSGYSPAYQFNWSEFIAFKAKGGKFSDFPNKKPLMLTLETIQSHLNGSQTIGIYPLLEDNTSYFIAADFDGENWQKESKDFLNICRKYNIPAYLERSRSGIGGHIWIFFQEKYPAFKSRAIVLELIRQSFNLSQIVSKILIFDSTRNKLITEDILREANTGQKILILTERKEHVEVLYQYLKGKTEIITLTGEDSASKRIVKMDQIKAGHFQILIATGQLFGEGMDFGTINCLFLVYPFSFEGKLIQYIGRIQRSKSQKIIYDYRDKNILFFDRLFKNRLRYYKR